MISATVALKPTPSFNVINPALANNANARPPLVGSFGIETVAPSGTSCTLCTLLLYKPIRTKIVLPIATKLEPFCLLKFSINGTC